MTKMSKSLAVALTAAMLASGLMSSTPAGAAHDPNISGSGESMTWAYHVSAALTDPHDMLVFSNDGGSTWTATRQQFATGETDPAQDNGDGPRTGMFQYEFSGSFSNDGGSTWTATLTQYINGEHDAAQDNGDGPAAGTFRSRRWNVGIYSEDGGSTWTRRLTVGHGPIGGPSVLRPGSDYNYILGEADPARDNGDGPDAGTFRYRSTWPEYSIDGGSTWTATEEQYAAGEADPAQDNGDGPAAGMFRSQDALIMYYRCEDTIGSTPTGLPGWQGFTTLNNPILGPCPNPQNSRYDIGLMMTTSRSYSSIVTRPVTRPYTWNVDDGIEPTGDWCVSGTLTDGLSIICRGEGYTYREARRELKFGLGRP